MRRNTNVVSTESTIEPQGSFLGSHFSEAIHHTAVWELAIRPSLLLLEAGLHKVERQTEETGEESGDGTGAQGPVLRR